MANKEYPYPIDGPFMDAGQAASRLKPGFMSKVVGIDGRFRGSAKPFPGFKAVKDLSDLDATISDITFFRYVEFQRGSANEMLRGYIVRWGSTLAQQEISFYYYDENDSTWKVYDIASALGATWANAYVVSTAKMDVTHNRRFCYIAVETEPPVVLYWTTSMQLKEMGPTATWDDLSASQPTVNDEATAQTGYYLEEGATYGYAYRLFDSTRNLYSAMSGVTYITPTADQSRWDFAIPGPTAMPAAFDYIDVYRTIDASVVGGSYTGGILYKERRVSKTDYNSATPTGEAGATQCYVGSLPDYELAVQSRYDPYQDIAGEPPESGAIIDYQGTTLIAEAPDSSVGGAGFRWSSVYRNDPENFTTARRYKGESEDGPVLRFVEAGDACFAFTPNVVYRIQKNGGQLTISRLHFGRGLVAADAGHGVGRDALVMSPSGLGILDGMNGSLQEIGAVDRIVQGDWAGNLGDTHSAFDAVASVSIFGNPTEGEAICVWHSGQSVSMMEDWYFVGATTGPLPAVGGVVRGQFVTAGGLVLTIDIDDTGTRTMFGLSSSYTLNGTASGGSVTTLVDAGATFHADMIGARVHVLTGDLAGTSIEITAVNVGTDTLTFGTQSSAVASGNRYAISPMPFKLRLWPVPPHGEGLAGFQRRLLEGMAVHAYGYSGITDNDNALWKLGAYREGSSTLTVSNTVAMSAVPADSYAYFVVDGVLLEPAIEVIASNVDFELTDALAYGTITTNEETE